MIQIRCPRCNRILGDTDNSLDCVINCPKCRKPVNVRMTIVKAADYLPKEIKEENND